LGSAPDNLTRFNETFNLSAEGQLYTGSPTKVMNGNDAYGNSYIASSVTAFSAMAGTDPVGAAALLKKSRANYVKPEEVKAFELGYRSVFEGTSIDINGYYNIYNNFIGNLNVVSPFYGTAQDNPNIAAGTSDPGVQSIRALQNGEYRTYQLYTNSDVEINSLGFGVGLSRKIISDFELGVNYNYAQFDFDQAKDPSFEPGFNTPKHRIKMSIGNDKLFKNFGFNVSGRWNSEYLWQAGFADGIIKEATVIDAQINYGIPKLKSVVKLGAANIGGKEYYQVIGAGLIGQQYFASWTINP
jgi:hypothetical protein